MVRHNVYENTQCSVKLTQSLFYSIFSGSQRFIFFCWESKWASGYFFSLRDSRNILNVSVSESVRKWINVDSSGLFRGFFVASVTKEYLPGFLLWQNFRGAFLHHIKRLLHLLLNYSNCERNVFHGGPGTSQLKCLGYNMLNLSYKYIFTNIESLMATLLIPRGNSGSLYIGLSSNFHPFSFFFPVFQHFYYGPTLATTNRSVVLQQIHEILDKVENQTSGGHNVVFLPESLVVCTREMPVLCLLLMLGTLWLGYALYLIKRR